MQYRHTLLAIVAATTVLAAPLNINMGAYSPALVVGDGEIGFKGTSSVTALMNTLQGAAANSAAANGAAAPAAAAPAAGAAPAAEAIAPAAAAVEPQGMGKNVLPLVTRTSTDGAILTPEEIEILEDEEEDLMKRNFEGGATLTAEEIEILEDEEEDLTKRNFNGGATLTAEEIEILEDEEEDLMKRNFNGGATLTAEEIEILEDEEDETSVTKRDIAGFNAALAYASGALKTSPEVQLGTGEGGSGVGITQKAGGVTTGAKTNTTAGRAEGKRDVVFEG